MTRFITKMTQILVFLVCFTSCLNAFAETRTRDDKCSQKHHFEKRYVEANNVVFDKKDIFVYLDHSWIKTNAIFSDEAGFYIPVDGWVCRNGHDNKRQMFRCEVCGAERD